VSLSIIILTYNEEQHIERCIASVKSIATTIYVIDSFSTDKTVELAKANGEIVLQNKWPNNHSKQLNWALENCDIQTKWVMRLDADEVVTPELADEIKGELSNANGEVKGFILNRGHIILGRKMMHGGTYPTRLMRIWEHGAAYCEDKLMDEHIVFNGDYEAKLLKGSFWDHNINNFTWWIEKHNSYSVKEAVMQLRKKYNPDVKDTTSSNKQSKVKRFLKHNIYEKFPKSLRSFFYFIYRYIFRLGFLDGYQGLVWNFLQGFWYRFLVDVKVYEIEQKAKEQNISVGEVIKKEYGYEL
jgi:glycosyltransferase involved in cell wall biosynthesis